MPPLRTSSPLPQWQRCAQRPIDPEPLPLAVAILVPATQTPTQAHQLTKLLSSVAFAQNVWLGQTIGPITDFAAARNSAASFITDPWVLWLDSDEWLETSSLVTIKLQRLLALPNVGGVAFKRQDWFLGKTVRHGEPAHGRFVRLIKQGTGDFHRPVHEIFTVKNSHTHDVSIINSDLIIQHESHASIAEFFMAVSRYAELEARFRFESQPPSNFTLLKEFWLFPGLKFLYNFGWLSGWKDGWRGLVYAIMMSIHSAAVRIYGWEYRAQQRHFHTQPQIDSDTTK